MLGSWHFFRLYADLWTTHFLLPMLLREMRKTKWNISHTRVHTKIISLLKTHNLHSQPISWMFKGSESIYDWRNMNDLCNIFWLFWCLAVGTFSAYMPIYGPPTDECCRATLNWSPISNAFSFQMAWCLLKKLRTTLASYYWRDAWKNPGKWTVENVFGKIC